MLFIMYIWPAITIENRHTGQFILELCQSWTSSSHFIFPPFPLTSKIWAWCQSKPQMQNSIVIGELIITC